MRTQEDEQAGRVHLRQLDDVAAVRFIILRNKLTHLIELAANGLSRKIPWLGCGQVGQGQIPRLANPNLDTICSRITSDRRTEPQNVCAIL